MQLWAENQRILPSQFVGMDMERTLQVLECVAEDELFRDHDTEIEIIERIMRIATKDDMRLMTSAKQQIRYSLFTIEEEDERNESIPNIPFKES